MEYGQTEQAAWIRCGGATYEVSFPAVGGVRIRGGRSGPDTTRSPVLAEEPVCLPLDARESGEGLTFTAGELALAWSREGRLVLSERGVPRWQTPPAALTAEEGRTCLRFASPSEDRVFGLGQDPAARLDHNHQERRMWNQWGGHERSGNCGVGVFLSTGGCGLLLVTPAAARFCCNESDPQPLDTLGEAMVPSPWAAAEPQPEGTALLEVLGALDVVLTPGLPEAALQTCLRLTGLPALMPKWAYGFLQCKNRYMNRDDLLETARRMRAAGVPCDALIVDWLWFREFGDLRWREDDWPNPEEMLRELAGEGFHVVSAQHPFLSENSVNYREFRQRGFLNAVPQGKRVTYDHTSPEARAFWWQKVAALYRQGLRGYWTDMGELEEHFEGTRSAAGDRLTTHNAYSLLWSQGLYEGQKRDFGTRAMILARSGCAGMQRYGAAVWSGDVNASWQVLSDQVRIGQGMAMSGLPWWCTDIGGFLSGAEFSPELYIRWMEWGVFCGIFRTHGTRPGNEPWSFGGEAEERIRALVCLRYRLIPTLYSLAMRCATTGRPMLRPFRLDSEAPLCEGQFYLGDDLLLAPVTVPGARKADVYIPDGQWVHWWSGRRLRQGWHTVPAPLGQPPLFVRAGAVLPTFARLGRNVAECGDLCVLAFPGDDGAFDYFDDEGERFDYREGRYTHARFSQRDGQVAAEAVRGETPAYRVERYEVSPAAWATDTAWQGDEATLTLTCLSDGVAEALLQPEAEWRVTDCTAGGCSHDLYETAYWACWSGTLQCKAGDCVRWTLRHTALRRRLREQSATLLLRGEDGAETRLPFRWDGPWLSNPLLAAGAPPDAAAEDATADGLAQDRFHWARDLSFARNCFGYVDFRRLGTLRDGERMMGEGWARETLVAETEGEACFSLRHDSPIELWLNGERVFCSEAANAPAVPVSLRLRKGKNELLIHQRADIARPYSGGEFGYALRLADSTPLWLES